MQLESINHLSGVYSSLITSLCFSLTLSNCFTGAGIFTVFLVSCLSLRITLRSPRVRMLLLLLLLSMLVLLLRPASIRIMLISVSSFKIIQINCGIYLGSFFSSALSTLSHTPGPIKNSTLARVRLTDKKRSKHKHTYAHHAFFGLDHLLLLFWFLLPHLGSVAVLKLSHKVWADSLTGSWTLTQIAWQFVPRSGIRYVFR